MNDDLSKPLDSAELRACSIESKERVAGVGGDLPADILAAGLRRDEPSTFTDEERG